MEAYNKVKRARTSLILKHPFFASLSLRLKFQEDYSCHTAWTDGEVFSYNPHYVNMLPRDKVEGLTAHIVMHPACNHHKRRNGRDHHSWNKACDYVINGILLDSGFTLPDGYLFKKEFCDRSAEAVYSTIIAEKDDKGDEESNEAENQQDSNESEETMEEEDQDSEGTAGDGEEDDDEGESELNGDPGLSGEVRDNIEGAGAGESSDNETDWDDALIQAAINARGIGTLPSSIERLLDKKLNPKLDWSELLQHFIERNARSDYSWIQPNKRFIHQNIYLPSLRNCELDNVFIAIDTSGSINQEDLNRFAAEISEILNQYPAHIHLLYCDYRISGHQEYSRSDLPITIKPIGRGGTDYRPVFNMIEAGNYNPSCLIYLTDLNCNSYPAKPPYYPTLWVNVDETAKLPPFGETITIR